VQCSAPFSFSMAEQLRRTPTREEEKKTEKEDSKGNPFSFYPKYRTDDDGDDDDDENGLHKTKIQQS
jgi:hypothetical protein